MPNISNATVINQPYNVGGNGGRKLVILDNGNQFACMKNGTQTYLYMTTDNWVTKTLVFNANYTATNDLTLASDGQKVFFLLGLNNASVVTRVFSSSGEQIGNIPTVDSNQTAMGNVTLAINEQKTELHASWSSKNPTYPNSFNIRYAKGTINADGSVTWGAVEQVTKQNNGYNIDSPSIVLDSNGIPCILSRGDNTAFVQGSISNRHAINIIKRDRSLGYKSTIVHDDWSAYEVYSLSAYAQSNPSAIYVPPTFSGTPNGRIWVAWQSRDVTSSQFGLRVAYSNDGGVTWTVELIRTASASVNEIKPPSIMCSTD